MNTEIITLQGEIRSLTTHTINGVTYPSFTLKANGNTYFIDGIGCKKIEPRFLDNMQSAAVVSGVVRKESYTNTIGEKKSMLFVRATEISQAKKTNNMNKLGNILWCTLLNSRWIVIDHDGEYTVLFKAENYLYPEFQDSTDIWKVKPDFFKKNFRKIGNIHKRPINILN